VLSSSMAEVAQDLKAVFRVGREQTAAALAEKFVELYRGRFPKTVSVFEAGIGNAFTYLHPEVTTPSCARRICWSVCSTR
jgi:hypothetical protein